MDYKWIVYKHTSPSGKVYIGITHLKKPEYRWNNGRGYKGQQYLIMNAIKKYGWENFTHEILYKDVDESFAKEKEKELIKHYKELGMSYNITDGGDGKPGVPAWNKGVPQTEEQKRINSIKNSGEHNGFYGKKHSEETKRKLSEYRKGKPAWNKGIPRTEEEKRKMSEGHKGFVMSEEQKQKISQSLKGKEFSKEYRKKLSDSLKGKKKSESHKKHLSESKKNRITIYKDNKIKYIKQEELNQYIKLGWIIKNKQIKNNIMSEFKANKAVLSCSGGMDSSMLLLKLLAQGKEVRCYSFDYGQKHRIELDKIKKNIEFLQSKGLPVSHQVINMVDVFSGNTSSLVASTGKDIPEGSYKAETMASTVVPVRNCIFSAVIFAKAINWAVETGENIVISLGVHGGDHYCYPDTRPESVEAMRYALSISDENSHMVDYEAPFVNIDKTHVLSEGIKASKILGWTNDEFMTFLSNTHTCYNPDSEGRSCGKCGSCVERQLSCYENGFEDPAEYSFRYSYDELRKIVSE